MISNCPKCARQVLLPSGAEADATVRCPLCLAEYELREALALAPPELILVAPRIHPIIETPSVAELPRVEDRSAGAAAAPSRTTWRPRRQKSALQTVIEVVAGGLAGVVVAYYGLAIYFGPQFHRVGLPKLPLPLISWITAPPAQGGDAQPNAAPNEPPPPQAGEE
jgi:hypothetical protein